MASFDQKRTPDPEPGSLEDAWKSTKGVLKDVNSVLPNVEVLSKLPIPALKNVSPFVSPILAGLGGGLTTLTHDPANDGWRGLVERLGVGGIDAGLGLQPGPSGLIDAFTGGNLKGLTQGAFTSLLTLTSGDTKTMQKQSDKMQQGDYGGLTAGLGALGDLGGQLLGKLVSGSDNPVDTTHVERNLSKFTDGLDQGSNWNPVNWVPKLGKKTGDLIGDGLHDALNPKRDPADLDKESRDLTRETDEIDRYSDKIVKMGFDPKQLKLDANMKDDPYSKALRETILDTVRPKVEPKKRDETNPFSMWEE